MTRGGDVAEGGGVVSVENVRVEITEAERAGGWFEGGVWVAPEALVLGIVKQRLNALREAICACGHPAKAHTYDLNSDNLNIDYDGGYGCDNINCRCELTVLDAALGRLTRPAATTAATDAPTHHGEATT